MSSRKRNIPTEKGKSEISKKVAKTENVNDEWIPTVAREFYDKFNGKCEAKFEKELNGPFRVLKGETDAKGLDIMMLDRTGIDLPEFQGFWTTNNGRYGFWRDEPNQQDPIICFYSDAEFFPEIKVVGNRIEHAVVHRYSSKKSEVSKILGGNFDENWEKEMKQVVAARRKAKVGDAPHDVGIWVKMNGKVGYRCLMTSSKKMRQILTTLKTTEKESEKEKQNKLIEAEFNHVQIANDESDFGMGLEYGHWLFLSNSKDVQRLAMFSLKLAYKFLKRDAFFKILDMTLKLRD